MGGHRVIRLATRVLVVSALALTALPLMDAGAGDADAGTAAPYVVVYKAGVDPATKTAALQTKLGFTSKFTYKTALAGMAASLTSTQLSSIQGDPDVLGVQTDLTVRAVDTIVTGDSAPTGAKRISAATTTTTHGAVPFSIAVLDSGVQLNHPDLNAVAGTDCVSSANGAKDLNGHGTHVAGVIAAKNNGSGVLGVSAGTRIVSVRVLDANATGTVSQVICGIDWVTANAATYNIKVANMSLVVGGSNDNHCGKTNNDPMHQSICNSVAKGVVYVAAAGNNTVDFASYAPAAYPEVLTVTAMSDSDGKPGGTGGSPTCVSGQYDDRSASFSNYAGSSNAAEQAHTIAGPGVCIKSTWINSTWQVATGTSVAAPHIAGTVALCLNKGTCAGTPSQIIAALRSGASSYNSSNKAYGFTGDPLHAVSGKYFGYLPYDGSY